MTEQKIIGKGTWIDKLAYELVEREKQLGRSTDLIRVESGLGASGIPHIGSLGDAVRAYGIKLALENFGYKSELIAYSDDLDGLRKIPEGLDVKKEDIGKRVSAIDDPLCDKHDSYGSHMSSMLLDGLDKLGIKYQHKTAHDTYKNGLLKDQIHRILVDSKKIGDKIEELTGQQKFQNVIPYFLNAGIVLKHCGNIDYIYSDQFANFRQSYDEIICDQKDFLNVLNIYFSPGLYRETTVTGVVSELCGYAPNPNLPTHLRRDRIFIRNSCCEKSTFAHELGHYFSLLHTHETIFGLEYVNGSNCENRGDLLCDTPADPNIYNLVNPNSCQYGGQQFLSILNPSISMYCYYPGLEF